MRRSLPTLVLCGIFLVACGPGEEEDGPSIIKKPSDGDPCAGDNNCEGNACLVDIVGYPDGYCTTLDCDTDADCSSENGACVQFVDRSSLCLARCEGDGDCRTAYECRTVDERRACLPAIDAPEEALPAPFPFEATNEALDFDCAPSLVEDEQDRKLWRFEFEISSIADSYLMVPTVELGTLLPARFETPSREVDLRDYRHHNTRYEDLANPAAPPYGTYGNIAFDWPILVPYAPRYADYVEPGTHVLEVWTDHEAPCLYVAEGRPETTLLEVDIYLVTSAYDVASASSSTDLSEMLDSARARLESVGVTIGEVRYRDVSSEVTTRFGVVRDLRDIDLVTATGAPRAGDREGHLKVSVFLVDSIIFSGTLAVGVSAGVPGPAGLHGNLGNGLVFGAADLGAENALTGRILAHELAHYLGLRHTTETLRGSGTQVEAEAEALFGVANPIEDTPVCEDVFAVGRNCPDYENLMFPVIQMRSDGVEPKLTEGQGEVLRASPLVR